ncbi:hypothetical protein GQ55_5G390900 [Panicum hallii var. hallii]|uniref:Reverse transcriptase zinc-binding domain-containing protein n=1 Tax=Panicum hallii var. hallii TaxID=1504633 RepID=A0A2T7DN05_9POAL|nr:hypothetical protein GQ55_5G390900 [Panicum hallii var. hallii]
MIDLCCQLLKQKYLRRSQFWRGMNKIKHGFSWGMVFKVNNGKSVRFWDDVWKGESPLRITFLRLYDLSNNKLDVGSDFLVNGNWHINLRRPLGLQDLKLWKDLTSLLEGVQLNVAKDEVSWALEKSGLFTTKSMYRWFSHRGVVQKNLGE